MESPAMKVGELARRTGFTVRTLHHYDEIGLLRPARRTRAGHRLYSTADVRRLQQIASLRQIGLSLDEIADCLSRPGFGLEGILAMQIRRLDEQIEAQRHLKARLERIRERLASPATVTVEELTETIQGTVTMDRYFSADQLEYLRKRGTEVGRERIEESRREWAELFEAYEDAMSRGLDPSSREVQELAGRSASLIREFTGGDPGILRSLTNMYREEGGENVMARRGMDLAPGVWEYMRAASAALRE